MTKRQTSPPDHQVSIDSAADFKRLFDQLKQDNTIPDRILHLWNVGRVNPKASALQRAQACRARGFDSLLYMVQGMGSREAHDPCLITVVSTGLADVSGDEAIEAEKAMLIGPCRVIPVEFPHLKCKSVDVPLADVADFSTGDVDRLLTEALHVGPAEVAFRGAHRWMRSHESIYFNPHGDPPPAMPTRLRPSGTYLITGGLGGIGLELAAHLANKVGARLILTSRSAATAEADAALARIEAAGGGVFVAKADVTDKAAMAAAIKGGIERFGPIHGVIHAAGVPGRGIMQLKTKDDVDRVLAPKVEGLLVLHDLVADSALDFFVVCSSIATAVGAPGQAEYTSANAFLDAFVAENRNGADAIICRSTGIVGPWSAWR